MPLFEYQCRDCGKPFEAFVTTARTAACPACDGTNLTKLLSRLGMVGVAAAPRSGSSRHQPPRCAVAAGAAARTDPLAAASFPRRLRASSASVLSRYFTRRNAEASPRARTRSPFRFEPPPAALAHPITT